MFSFKVRYTLEKNLDILLVVLLFFIFIFINFPGFMTNDSNQQYRAAISGNYDGRHPPIMSLIWRTMNYFWFGPQNVLILHNVFFFLGLFLLCRHCIRSITARILTILLVSVFPPVFVQLGVIWKDTGMATAYLLTTALILISEKKKLVTLFMFPILFYGTAVRHNAIVAFIPIAFWMSGIFVRSNSIFYKSLWFFIFVLAMYGSVSVMNQPSGDQIKPKMFQNTQIHDLAGISVLKGEVVFDEFKMSISKIKRFYNPTKDYTLGNKLNLKKKHSKEFAKNLNDAWKSQLKTSFNLYLHHRWLLFRGLLGIKQKSILFPYATTGPKNNTQLSVPNEKIKKMIYGKIGRKKNGLLFRGWIYALLVSIMFMFSWFRKLEPSLLYISASGFFYFIPYFIIAPSSDFRYLYWTVDSAIIWIIVAGLPDQIANFLSKIRNYAINLNSDLVFPIKRWLILLLLEKSGVILKLRLNR